MNTRHYISIILISALQASGLSTVAAAEAATKNVGPLTRSVERADLVPFSSWAARYIQATDAGEKNRMLAEGVRLATERRAVLSSLIQSDPQQALASSLSGRALRALPRQVTDQLETPVSGIGDFEVLCPFPEKTQMLVEPIHRVVRINGKTYSASVYGRRLFQGTQTHVPLHGVVANGVVALDEEVLRELRPGERPDPSQEVLDVRPVASTADSASPVLAEAGGKVFRFASREQLRLAEALLEGFEQGLAPEADDALGGLLQKSLGYKVQPKSRAHPKNAVNTVNPGNPELIRVLLICVDFSDLPGDPAPQVKEFMDENITTYYLRSSYGHVILTNTLAPQLYRMPQTAATYAGSYSGNQLHDDAESAAAADCDLPNYDRIVVIFRSLGGEPNSQVYWGGLAEIGGSRVWVNGEVDFRVLAHELGHTFGLWHAGVWQTTDGNPVSDSGTPLEYGDIFDTMSANFGNDTRVDFNMYSKREIGWIDDTQVQTVTTSGIYRVHRIDGPTASGVVGLKVVKDGSRDYWIGCRRNFTENTSMMHGAYIIWAYNWPSYTYLIETVNPGGSPRDAALPIDWTLIDPEANLTITPVAEGGAPPNEYLDVQITFGPPPIISTQSRADTVVAGQSATFTVQASGNPPPSYQWEYMPHGSTAWIPLSDNGTYSGSHSASFSIEGNTLAMNGDQFRCVLTNSSGGFNCTQPAVLTVLDTGVSTLAGDAGVSGSQDGISTTAQFNSPVGLVVDSAGNILVADTGNSRIRHITFAGVVSTFAEVTGTSESADGASNTLFHSPVALALDNGGNLYVVDQGNCAIFQVTPEGDVKTLAGLIGVRGLADGQGESARFNYPGGITVDAATNIYVADTGSHTIRRVSLDGLVVTFAGVTAVPGNTDGAGRQAHFNSPTGLACDQFGNVFVADQANCAIRKITPEGLVSTVAGLAGAPGTADGIGSNARFNYPTGIAIDESGNLYVADRNSSTIRKVTPAGVVSTLAGVPGKEGYADGPLNSAQFMFPSGVALDAHGLLCVADTSNNAIRLLRVTDDPAPPEHGHPGKVPVNWQR